MFARGWSTKSGDGGRGLGLALVQQAVRRLHGSIEVSADHGAVFEVLLPLTHETETEREEVEDAARARG